MNEPVMRTYEVVDCSGRLHEIKAHEMHSIDDRIWFGVFEDYKNSNKYHEVAAFFRARSAKLKV